MVRENVFSDTKLNFGTYTAYFFSSWAALTDMGAATTKPQAAPAAPDDNDSDFARFQRQRVEQAQRLKEQEEKRREREAQDNARQRERDEAARRLEQCVVIFYYCFSCPCNNHCVFVPISIGRVGFLWALIRLTLVCNSSFFFHRARVEEEARKAAEEEDAKANALAERERLREEERRRREQVGDLCSTVFFPHILLCIHPSFASCRQQTHLHQ